MSFTSQNTAIELREIMRQIADERINILRPSGSYAVVTDIDRTNRSAQVIYAGTTTPVTVEMGSIEPSTTGQSVRIGGSLGHRYIEDVLGDAIMSGADLRYAEIGHTHSIGGGGEITVTLNDLTDVDTVTNAPSANWLLAWSGSIWRPYAHDHSAQFLSLTGGTVVGTLNVTTLAATTISATGSITGNTLVGNGSGITSINASNLTTGTLNANLLPATLPGNISGSAAKLTTPRNIQISGDVAGVSLFDGSADINISATIQANAVTLGTDTVGDYVKTVTGTANQIIMTPSAAGEGTDHVLSLPQNIHSASTPTFSRLTLTQAIGTSPMVITSTTMVANLTAEFLGATAQNAAYFRNATNLNAGTVDQARIPTSLPNLTSVGTLTTLTVTGAATFTANPTVGGNALWHAGNDGPASGLDADTVDGAHRADLAEREELEALLGDIMYVGLYDAAAYDGDTGVIVTGNGDGVASTRFSMNTANFTPAADAAFDVRCEVRRPPNPASGQRRPTSTPWYFNFQTTSLLFQFLASDASFPSTSITYTAGMPQPGQRIQLRAVWVPGTDTLTMYWRSATADLLNNTGWTAGTGTVNAGKQFRSTVGAWAVGGTTDATAFNDRWYRATASINSVATFDVKSSDIPNTSATTFTATLGGTITLVNKVATSLTMEMPQPDWAEGPDLYRHGMYWVAASSGELNFIDSDLSGRFEVGADDPVDVFNGDWIIANDPLFGQVGHEVDTSHPISSMSFQFIPFSSETFVKAQISAHAQDPADPHSAANYLTRAKADPLYAPITHNHNADINALITTHSERTDDPHAAAGYLTNATADLRYISLTAILPYEPTGAVLAHEQKTNPHPQYTTKNQNDALYAVLTHNHDGTYSLTSHTHAVTAQNFATDGAQSSRFFHGDFTPGAPLAGDVWLETPNIALQPPSAPVGLSISATPTTVTISWTAYAAGVNQTEVQVDWSADGVTGWTNLLTDVASIFDTSYTHTGRGERTTYYYRVRARNATGYGAYGTVSTTTGNNPPNVPTSLSVTGMTASSLTLNWIAPSAPANDPLHATQPYEVFLNSVSQGYVNALNKVFSTLSENTNYTLAVRSQDSAGLFSSTVSASGTTANANPPTPTSPVISGVTHNVATLAWTAPTGFSDFRRYAVYANDVLVTTTTSTSYQFTGLTPSTAYKLEVRTEDIMGLFSTDNACFANTTTAVNPDSTPPNPVTGVSWKPEGNYGEMHFRFTTPSDTYSGDVYWNTGSWVYKTSIAGGGNTYNINMGTWGAGTTVYAMVHIRDAAGNWRYGDAYGYTLVASPTAFYADASNQWRNTNSGQWGGTENHNAYQDYYSSSSLNARGAWFYGTKFQNTLGGKTVTACNIYMTRVDGGYGNQAYPHFWTHLLTTNPGTVWNWGDFALYDGQYEPGVGIYAPQSGSSPTEAWIGLPANWGQMLVDGSRRGIAIHDNTPQGLENYSKWAMPSQNGNSGLVHIYHLG